MRLLAPGQWELGLRTRAHAWLFLGCLTLAGLNLIYFGGKAAVVDTLAQSQDIDWLERAVRLDPFNPLPHYQLGARNLFSFEQSDSIAAVHHLRAAVELNPNNGPYWLALGAALESAGDARAAQVAFQRALDRRPMSPEYWWRAANYYLRAGKNEIAWAYFRRVLELSPDHAGLVFQLCYRAAGDYRVVSERVLPREASPALRLAYVDFLSSHGDDEGASHVWRQFDFEGRPINATFPSAQPYLDGLIAKHRTDEAKLVWDDLLNWQIIRRPYSSNPGDALFNGDFEQGPLNGGFDWRTTKIPYVVTDLQSPAAFRGAKSAQVDFTVKHNEEYEILSQFVPVESGHEYRLRAFVRSEGITSDSGPRLRVVDAESPARLHVSTPPVTGTTEWHPVELTFSTGPDTRLVRFAVWRARSRAFPTEISGRFWIDAVSMTALGSRSEAALSPQLHFP